jgi:hypothetical protein
MYSVDFTQSSYDKISYNTLKNTNGARITYLYGELLQKIVGFFD